MTNGTLSQIMAYEQIERDRLRQKYYYSATPIKKPNAVVLGKFLLHKGHIEYIDAALEKYEKVLVVIGSAFEAQTLKNPLTYETRKAMIEAQWPNEVASGRMIIDGLQDHTYRNSSWNRAFKAIIRKNLGDLSLINNVDWFCCAKDEATAKYMDEIKIGLNKTYHISSNPDISSTAIRTALYEGVDTSVIPNITPDVAMRLQSFKLTEEYEIFVKEWAAIRKYNESWATAPFPPHFVAVDALVSWEDRWKRPHILVGVRKSDFGNGKLCIPGGYLEVAETLYESATRELLEETGLTVDDAYILDNVTVFDDPNRSMRGRMLTHVHKWRCVEPKKPVPVAGDDLSDAFWIPIDEVYANKRNFFSDHYYIISKLFPIIEEFENAA